MVEQKITCDQCGTRAEEWDETKGGSRHAYLAETFICPGCHTLDNAQEAARQEMTQSKRSMMPVKFRLKPYEDVERDRATRRLGTNTKSSRGNW